MTSILNHSLAAFAAVFLAVTSIGAIVTVPPAHAQATPGYTTMIGLA